MIKSSGGHKYLLVCVCPISRYLKNFPLKTRSAVEVAKIILQRICFKEGKPDSIVYDQDTSFQNQVVEYKHSCLKIKQIFVIVENHCSLVVERHIRTIANLIISNLSGNGRAWHLYSNAATYAYNSFAMTSLDGLCPYEIICGKKHPP